MSLVFDCEFVDGQCRRCGYQLKTDKTPHRNCSQRCQYLAEKTGGFATVVCKTCKTGKIEQEHPVHSCQVHGECLPTYRCTRTTREALAEWMEREGRIVEIATCRGCLNFTRSP